MEEDFFEHDPEMEQQDYSELIQKIEDGSTLETIRTSYEWRLFREVWRRLAEGADKQLDSVDPSNIARVVEAQLIKRFYKDVLTTTILKIKDDAEAAYEQAKEEGILEKISTFLKQVVK